MANRKVQTTMYKTLHRKQRPSNTNQKLIIRGGSKRERTLKLEKIWFFGVKSWFFTRNTPTIFAPPSARRNFFKCALPPNLNSWIRPWSCYHFAGYIFFFVVLEVTYAKLTLIPSSCSINIRGCPSFSADNSCLTCCRRAGCDRGDCDHYTCKCSGCPWH
jgi:hypothetical protein